MFGRELNSVCAGRTDAGVHALGQVMNVPGVPGDAGSDRIKDSLNGMLGPAIAISRCVFVPDDFQHASPPRSRSYIYAILESRDARSVPRAIDACGTEATRPRGHERGRGAPDRAITTSPPSVGCRTVPPQNATSSSSGARETTDVIRIRARANAFIQQMVRSLVGTLV